MLMAKKKTSSSSSAGAVGGARTPAKGVRETAGIAAKPVTMPVPPPAYTTRSSLPPIQLSDFAQAVAVTAAGAVVAAIFISVLKGGAKFLGAAVSAGIGVLFTATSPMGSIPSELGIGMLSSSTGWFVFEAMGKLRE